MTVAVRQCHPLGRSAVLLSWSCSRRNHMYQTGVVEIHLPYASCDALTHFEVVNLVFFSMDKCVACCFSNISSGVYFVTDHAFFALISFCFEWEKSIWCIDGCETVILWKPCFILKLGTNGPLENGLDSSDVRGQFFKGIVSKACNSNTLLEVLDSGVVRSICCFYFFKRLLWFDWGLPNCFKKWWQSVLA